MPTGLVEHSNQAVRHNSPNIWKGVPVDEWRDGNGGVYMREEFLNFPKHNSAQQTQLFASYIDTGVTIQQAADTVTVPKSEWGVAKFTHDGTDNDEASLQFGGNTGGVFTIPLSGYTKLCFEARVKKSTIADDGLAFFCGLAAPGLAAADTLIDDTGALASNKFLGFRVKHDNGEELDFVHKTSSGEVEVIAALASLAADTWFKIGFVVDPRAPLSKRIRIFYNGAEQTTYGTHASIQLATFPSATALMPLFACKIGTASAFTASLDWIACGQEITAAGP